MKPKKRQDRIGSAPPAVTVLGLSRSGANGRTTSFKKYAAHVREGLQESAVRRASKMG